MDSTMISKSVYSFMETIAHLKTALRNGAKLPLGGVINLFSKPLFKFASVVQVMTLVCGESLDAFAASKRCSSAILVS